MGYYEIVTASEDKCTVLVASDDREVCMRAVDTHIKPTNKKSIGNLKIFEH